MGTSAHLRSWLLRLAFFVGASLTSVVLYYSDDNGDFHFSALDDDLSYFSSLFVPTQDLEIRRDLRDLYNPYKRPFELSHSHHQDYIFMFGDPYIRTVHRPVRARRSRPFFQRIPKQSIR